VAILGRVENNTRGQFVWQEGRGEHLFPSMFERVKMKIFIHFVLAMVFVNSYLGADSLFLSLVQNMTNNLFQNRLSEADQVSNLSFSLDKDFSSFSLFSSGEYSYLFENSDVIYCSLELGMDYLHPLGGKTALYVSLTGSGTFYKEDYRDFNYLNVNGFMALKSYIHQTSILRSHYSFVYRKYRAPLFDYWSHGLFLSVDKYFQSRTTLKGELNWGFKYFTHPYQDEDADVELERHVFHRGMGKGRHSGGSTPSRPSLESEGEGIQIISLSALLAQGLGNKVGLNFSVTKQMVISGQNPFESVYEFYLVENPSYDRFSWDGYEAGSQLTVLMPWTVNLKIGYTYSNKMFPGIESYSLEEESLGITRRDRRGRIDLRLEKIFARISVFVHYAFVDNRSNDPLFDWNGHFISLGFEWNHFYGGQQ